MGFNLIQIAGIIAGFLSIFMALYFYQTRKEKIGNQSFFAGLLVVFAVLILCSLFLSSGINRQLFLLSHIGNQSIFLVGPLVYFYINSYSKTRNINRKVMALHALPFVVATVYLSIKLYFIPLPITCRSNHIMLGSIAFAHSFVYFFLSGMDIKNAEENKSDDVIKIESQNLKWLRYIVYGSFSVLLIKMMFFIVWDVSGFYQGCNELVNLYFLTSFFLVNIFTYVLLLKPQLFQQVKKYKHSVLQHSEKEKYKSELLSILEKEKIYRNPLITLDLLSKKLSIPSRYLSQIINETLDVSYYELINRYRIQDCIQQLTDSDNSKKTILEIAYDAGFNSKSTFNTHFVKFTGVTPKEYRKNPQSVSDFVFN